MGVERDQSVDELLKARVAYERRDWAAALRRLRGMGGLGTRDTFALATAAYLTGEVDEAIRALQGGYQQMIKDGDGRGAVRFGFWIALILNLRGEVAVGGGWAARTQRLLTDEPDDIVERGYVAVHEVYRHLGHGDFASAGEAAGRVVESGRRFGDSNLMSIGLMCQGRLRILTGQILTGLALLDEAMVGISAGEVSPIFAGMVYCSMIEACQEVSDLERAASWTSALTRWCDTQPSLVAFTGQCALHRGQIMRLHGAYNEAIAEFAMAQRRYRLEGATAPAALALTEQGDVLRIQGLFDEAEACYRQAAELGHEPQPGLALSWAARGNPAAALSAIRRLLAESHGPVQRLPLLPAAVEMLVTAHLPDEARQYCDELSEIASAFGNPAVKAMAGYASARVELATGDAAQALGTARESSRLWSALGSPFEAARCRVVVARALRELGDPQSATSEFAIAGRAFADLGAGPAAHEVEWFVAANRPGGLTKREVEVLSLVAEGRSNHDIADALVLSQKTVERHLSNIFAKLDVSSRTAAAAYAHEHGLTS